MRNADRLGKDVVSFVERVKKGMFAVPSAYTEFQEVMEGVGPDGIGIGMFERFIKDLERLSRTLRKEETMDLEVAVRALGLSKEDSDRIIRWLAAVGGTIEKGSPLDRIILDKARGFEMEYHQRMSELMAQFPRRAPGDTTVVEAKFNELQKKWPGGRSWKWDSRILAETHGLACGEDILFVTEDLKHIKKRKDGILGLTKIKDIVGLDGQSL
jgi:hypothetical protein